MHTGAPRELITGSGSFPPAALQVAVQDDLPAYRDLIPTIEE